MKVNNSKPTIFSATACHSHIGVQSLSNRTSINKAVNGGFLAKMIQRFDSKLVFMERLLNEMTAVLMRDGFLSVLLSMRNNICRHEMAFLEATVVIHALDFVFSWPFQLTMPAFGRDVCFCFDTIARTLLLIKSIAIPSILALCTTVAANRNSKLRRSPQHHTR